jgi:hypothetical protein
MERRPWWGVDVARNKIASAREPWKKAIAGSEISGTAALGRVEWDSCFGMT